MKPAEFDSHAAHYDGGLDNPIKRLVGSSADQFIAVKARWLLRHEPELASGGLAVLDYGCGAGDLMRVLAGLDKPHGGRVLVKVIAGDKLGFEIEAKEKPTAAAVEAA